jgi:hypothetical protein
MLPSSLINPNPAPAQQNNNAAANNTPEDGRLEVGKRNRTVITRSIRSFLPSLDLYLYSPFLDKDS